MGITGLLLHIAMRRRNDIGIGLLVSALGIALAVWSVSHATEQQSRVPDTSGSIELHGRIANTPEQRGGSMLYIVQSEYVRRSATGAWLPWPMRVRIQDRNPWPVYQQGEDVVIAGKLRQRASSGSFAHYLQLWNIDATIDYASIRPGERTSKTPMLYWLGTLRTHVESRIALLYSEPSAALLTGLITGSRRDLPARVTQAFERTSLTHIVAISGFNITIILSGVAHALFFLPLRWRFLPSIVCVCLFTLFVGASASVVRAAIMGIIGLFALQTGRVADMRRSILWTCLVMTLWNPMQLWYDAGFHLSFLAVIGLTEITPVLKPLLRRLPATLGIRETVCATLAAQCTAMPLVIYQFHTLSLISPLANVLIVPLVPWAMAAGAVSIAISWLHPLAGLLTSLPAALLLRLMVYGADALASLPYAALTLDSPRLWVVCLWYAALGCILWYAQSSVRQAAAQAAQLTVQKAGA